MPNNKLQLYKAHDYCAVKNPKLIAVFIHGLASDSTTFNNLLQFLEETRSLKNVRFVSFDLLGSGQSLKSDDYNYDYDDQLKALQNSIEKLNIDGTPLVLIGHSLGTLITTRYASTHKQRVHQLILISPPIYTEQDLDNPAFSAGMKAFQKAVSAKNNEILKEKAFLNTISNIIMDRDNYRILSEIEPPTVMIYGDLDQFIGSYNIPTVLKNNPEYITAIKTEGHHSITKDKYNGIKSALEKALVEETENA